MHTNRHTQKSRRTSVARCAPKSHGRWQRVENRSDGSRVQICDCCGQVVAVITKAQRSPGMTERPV